MAPGRRLRALFAASAAIVAVLLIAAPAAMADDAPVPTPTPTPPTTTPTTPAGPQPIAAGVTIGGTPVGGLTQREAKELVTRKFARSLQLVVSPGHRSYRVLPQQLGARALIGRAVAQASLRREGFPVPLTVLVDDGVLARFLAKVGRQTNREPVDAKLRLVAFAPTASEAAEGRRLQEVIALQQVRLALRRHVREPLQLPYQRIEPKVDETNFGKVIVIRRESRQLYFYNGTRLKRMFRVATGQSSYPTPLGKYEIITKQRHPWWYPPAGSAWAQGKEPVPPGPGNPLGTRWMGISSPYVGIHGTPDAASIGYSASHGCVRMLIPQVEWLFERVEVGTPVYIVPA